MSIDETSIPSLIGLLRCQAMEYQESKQSDISILNDMKDQIEFLDQVHVDPVSFYNFEVFATVKI